MQNKSTQCDDRPSPQSAPELAQLLAQEQIEVVRWDLLSHPHVESPAYRLDLSDGSVRKARLFGHLLEAETVEHFLNAMPSDRFPHTVCRHHRAVMSTWIEGQPLEERQLGEADFIACGELLGAIHTAAVPEGPCLRTLSPTDVHSLALNQAQYLSESEVITDSTKEALVQTLLTQQPSATTIGFGHFDFSLDNLVKTKAGGILSIDHGAIRVGSLDQDLARTRLIWPMRNLDWDSFLEGYRKFRATLDFDRHGLYWEIVVTLRRAIFHATRHSTTTLQRLASTLTDLASTIKRSNHAVGATRRIFIHSGFTVAVSTRSSVWDLTWLSEFLSPQFSQTPPAGTAEQTQPDWTLETRVDPRAYNHLRESLTLGAKGRHIDCFSLDGEYETGVLLQEDPHRLIFSERRKAFLRMDLLNHNIEILTERIGKASRMAMMRVLRELAIAHGVRAGAISLHASAFEVDGKAFVVAGPRRSGKTSALLHGLRDLGARLITNDRSMLLGAESWTVRGLPTILKIRSTSRSQFPELFERYETLPYHFSESIAEFQNSGMKPQRAQEALNGHALSLSQAQLCELVGCEQLEQAEVRAILFPRVDLDGPGECELLTPKTALQKLTENIFKSGESLQIAEAFRLEDDRSLQPSEPEQWSHSLAASIPCYRCTLGTNMSDIAKALNSVQLLGRKC